MKYEVSKISGVRSDYGRKVLENRGVKDIENFLNPTEEHSL